jgi:hypothetical protein
MRLTSRSMDVLGVGFPLAGSTPIAVGQSPCELSDDCVVALKVWAPPLLAPGMFYHGANNAVDDMRVVGAACILGIVTAIGWRRGVSRVAGRREEACLPGLAGRGRCGQSLQILQTFAAEPHVHQAVRIAGGTIGPSSTRASR